MSTVCLYIEGDAQGKSEVTMAEGSPQGKREALIRLVKERMARPEYADSPSVMLVCHFFLRLLNALENADPDEWESLYDIKRKIMQGDTRTIHLIAEDESCSDDSTPEGMRRDILRILDSIIEETSSEGRIFCSFFRNALHVAREENSCIQATIAKKENNTYDVALKITIPPIEPESGYIPDLCGFLR